MLYRFDIIEYRFHITLCLFHIMLYRFDIIECHFHITLCKFNIIECRFDIILFKKRNPERLLNTPDSLSCYGVIISFLSERLMRFSFSSFEKFAHVIRDHIETRNLVAVLFNRGVNFKRRRHGVTVDRKKSIV